MLFIRQSPGAGTGQNSSDRLLKNIQKIFFINFICKIQQIVIFSHMQSIFNENPTREKILLLIKKNGPLSIENLSGELNITSMGIRQHLLSLERKGLIDYMARRQGIGRPAFLYKLTEKAESLFPKSYDSFIVNTLKDIEQNSGHTKIEEIFNWQKNRMLKEAREAVDGKSTFGDKVYGIRNFLDSKGYFADVSDTNNHYLLKLYNCPIYKVADEFRDVCRHDLQLLRDLFGSKVNRESCIIEGDTSCTYNIPKSLETN
jgi:predicted ArsR family transcriptional regulator